MSEVWVNEKLDLGPWIELSWNQALANRPPNYQVLRRDDFNQVWRDLVLSQAHAAADQQNTISHEGPQDENNSNLEQ